MATGWELIDSYSKWMFSTYKDYVHGSVAEIATGLGRMIPFYYDQSESIFVTELDDGELIFLNDKFGADSKIRIEKMDILF